MCEIVIVCFMWVYLASTLVTYYMSSLYPLTSFLSLIFYLTVTPTYDQDFLAIPEILPKDNLNQQRKLHTGN